MVLVSFEDSWNEALPLLRLLVLLLLLIEETFECKRLTLFFKKRACLGTSGLRGSNALACRIREAFEVAEATDFDADVSLDERETLVLFLLCLVACEDRSLTKLLPFCGV